MIRRLFPLARLIFATHSIGLILSASTAIAAEARDAHAQPDRGKDRDPSKLLEVHPKEAGSSAVLAGSARAYGEARQLLARGKAAQALKAVAQGSSGLLDDREALLRGDALLALGSVREAKDAYLEAIEKSELKAVSLAAGRGMVNVLAQLKDREEQLLYIDALLSEPQVPRKANLLFERALVLRDLGRLTESADVAWHVVQDFPAAKIAAQANTVLKELKKRGAKIPVTNSRIELARIKNLLHSGDFKRAEAEIDKLEEAEPRLRAALDLDRAEIFKKKRMKAEEFEILQRLYESGQLTRHLGAEVVWRLGKLAMNRDDIAEATRYFDELADKYPASPHTDEAQYLAAWLPYNMGEYDVATERMLKFASEYRRSPNRGEALWYAGWSAYLANKDGLARRAFAQLFEEHPTSEMKPQAMYWIGRIRQRGGEPDAARSAYREVLAQSPLSYWGFWAIARLDELGEQVVLNAPPPQTVAPIPKVIAMLGPKRPRGIDRAVALNAANLQNDALEELTAVNTYLKGVRDTAGRTMVADLLHTLGAHYLAYRVGASITQDGGELQSGKPWAWRAWRHAYPMAFEKEVEAASAAHALDEHLILSIMRTESSFRTSVRSPVGAYGLMQLMPATAQLIGHFAREGRGHAARFRTPESNVWLGGWYLAKLVTRYGGQIAPAIGAYNAGPGAMDKWVAAHGGLELDEFVERIPYRETRRYVRRVLETYLIYRRLNGQPPLDLRGKVRDLVVPEGSVEF